MTRLGEGLRRAAEKVVNHFTVTIEVGEFVIEESEGTDDPATIEWKAKAAKPGTAVSSRDFKDEAAKRDKILADPIAVFDADEFVISHNSD